MLPQAGLAGATHGPHMTRYSLAISTLLLVACDGGASGETGAGETGGPIDTADTSDSGDTGGGDTDPDPCNGNTPQVVQFDGQQGDNTTDNGQPIPAVNFFVAFIDPDGDVNQVMLSLWADTTQDQTIDKPNSPVSEVGPVQMSVGTEPVADCEGFEGSVVFALGITGRGLEYETEYEFAIAVEDTHGVASEPAFLVYTTPAPVQ